MGKGLCGICGRGGKLTEEHIPPECAGNFHGVNLHTMADWLAAGGIAERMENGRPRPKGTFWTTLCENCNSKVLGSWYVPDFCKFVQGITVSLLQVTEGKRENLRSYGVGAWSRVSSETPIRPLCVVKVIAGMVLALNAESDPSFRDQHSALADFVLNRDLPLPDSCRAYIAIHDGDYAAFAPTMFKGSKQRPEEAIAFSAIEVPPLAYIMTFNESDPDNKPFLPCGGLYNFGRVSYDSLLKFEIDLLVGFRDTPVPGNYGQAGS